MKKTLVMGLILAFTLTWVGSLPAQPKEKIKIGVLGPMSGAGAAWGINMQRGVSLAIEDINNAGGVKVGSKTYSFEMVPADDKYTGAVAVSEGSRLIFEQKVKYVLGPIGSSPTVAFSPLMNENKILFLHNSFTPKALGPQYPYNFRALCSTSHEIAPILWKYVKDKYKAKTAVLLGQNDETGKAETDHDMDACNELGIKVVHRELFDLATTDFMPIATKAMAMKPDAIEIGSAATGYVSQLAKALYELGYKGVLVSNTLSGEADIMVPIIGKDACEGLVSSNIDWSSDDATPWMREFYKRYITKFGKPFGGAAAWIYWPVIWLKEGMEQTKSLEPDALKKYFETPGKKFKHYFGDSQFGGKKYYGINHQFKVHIPISEIRNGKNVMVQKPQIPPLELD